MANTGKDSPLRVEVKNGELVIRIGVSTLAYSQHFRQWNAMNVHYAVKDEEAFAHEVRATMQHEEEDGSSPLTDFVDACCDAALDDGCVATEEAVLRYQVWFNGQPWRDGKLMKDYGKALDLAVRIRVRRAREGYDAELSKVDVKTVFVTKSQQLVVET